jgi:hypothetical protein
MTANEIVNDSSSAPVVAFLIFISADPEADLAFKR